VRLPSLSVLAQVIKKEIQRRLRNRRRPFPVRRFERDSDAVEPRPCDLALEQSPERLVEFREGGVQ
jgi:hypothetical protein